MYWADLVGQGQGGVSLRVEGLEHCPATHQYVRSVEEIYFVCTQAAPPHYIMSAEGMHPAGVMGAAAVSLGRTHAHKQRRHTIL
jgi:hypothetical protein